MSKFGKIIWQDLTVENAVEVKDFYCQVVGWSSSGVDQGDYEDFNIINKGDNDQIVAGICHKRGDIKNFPSQWLLYVTVENLDHSIEKCRLLGGKIIEGPSNMGKALYAIIQDPAGAYMVLFQE